MRRSKRLREGLSVSSALLVGPLVALLLALAEYARLAALLSAMSLALAGYFLRRLAERRGRNAEMRRLRREIGRERRLGRLCAAIGVTLAVLAASSPTWIAVALGLVGSTFAVMRGLAVMGDSANRERDLAIGNLSPADECPHIDIWARRIAALPGRLPERIGRMANRVPASGKIRGARLAALALAAGTTLANVGVTGALVYEKEHDSGRGQTREVVEHVPEEENGQLAAPTTQRSPSDPTYENECPNLPDPLEIGHGLGRLFRFDGAFKAGCGTRAQQVVETGAWFSRGICSDRLRSVAIVGPDEDKAIVYGRAAEFALRSARAGELVSAEGARPAGGDVYVIETLAGSYGFARKAAASNGGGDSVRDCTDVTGTARPFAELLPPIMLLWRNLLERRGEWVWPLPAYDDGNAVTFAAHSTEVASGGCDTESSCYLVVDEIPWPGEGTAYVSLAEVEPYMPPLASYPGT